MSEIAQQFKQIKTAIRQLAEDLDGAEDSLRDGRLSNLMEELEMQYRELQARNRELEHTRRQLDESRRKYRHLFLFSPVGHFLLDESYLILDANNVAADLLSTDIGNIVYRRFQAFIIPADREKVNHLIKESSFNRNPLSEKISLRSDTDGAETPVRILCQRENEINAEHDIFRVTVIDQSLLLQVEELQEKSMELRRLTYHIQSVREEEREMAGKMVHDELGQSLTALNMYLARLKKLVPEHNGSARNIMGEMEDIILESIASAQQITSDLRPQMIDELGFVAAIENEMDSIQAKSGMVCKFSADMAHIDFRKEAETDLYRIIRELLVNTIRHARATGIFLNLSADESNLLVWYRDNGRGASEKDLKAPTAFGILSINERVDKYNGDVNFFPENTDGFAVRIQIPLSQLTKGAAA